ncbi:MAG: DNA primase [Aquificae bacterium]|nr:DNA primase [Aquificota bacterium]
MAISPETVEEVLRVANVYDVVSQYLPLEKTGSNYKALCPFHTEKTPSFIVSPHKNIFKCFGCGKSGTALTFVMEYEGLSFADAVVKLAEKYNIPVKYTKNSQNNQQTQRLLQITEKIKEFYKEQLKKSPQGKEYIRKRGILPTTVEKFEIGYSPTDQTALREFIQKEGISVDELKEVGLVSIKEDGKFYDIFRGRVIFPIKDYKGRVVAFGGRSIDGREPKYINSPETKIYSKGKVLYGFYEAKDSLREKKEGIVVEGYMDMISLYQIGVKNVVATLGTAMTPEHGKLLSKFIKKAILMFDSDKAGKKAVINACKILLQNGIEPLYCPLDKKDPDELAKEGYTKVKETLSKAENFLLFLIQSMKKQKDLKKRKELLDLYLSIVSYIPKKTEQAFYLQQLSEATGIPISLLQVEEKTLDHSKAQLEEEEKDIDLKKLSFNEKLILKGLLLHRDEILNNFNDFDKIKGSPYFLYLVDTILNNGEVEDLQEILKLEIPSDPQSTLYALNKLHKLWQKEQKKLEILFMSELEEKNPTNIGG